MNRLRSFVVAVFLAVGLVLVPNHAEAVPVPSQCTWGNWEHVLTLSGGSLTVAEFVWYYIMGCDMDPSTLPLPGVGS